MYAYVHYYHLLAHYNVEKLTQYSWIFKYCFYICGKVFLTSVCTQKKLFYLLLELKYAEETAALKPPLQYTPWVVVGGKPINKEFSNLRTYVCKFYRGSSLPDFVKQKWVKLATQ